MDLFDYMREKELEQNAPLASRIRPQTLDDIVGQQHILGKNKFLYRAIKADKLDEDTIALIEDFAKIDSASRIIDEEIYEKYMSLLGKKG